MAARGRGADYLSGERHAMKRDLATLQLLRRVGSGFAPASHTHGMADLTGFDITAPTTGDVLVYDGSKWVNDAPASGGGGNPAIAWVI